MGGASAFSDSIAAWSRRIGRSATVLGSAGLAPATRNVSARAAELADERATLGQRDGARARSDGASAPSGTNTAPPQAAVDLAGDHAAELRSRGTPKATVAQAGEDALADSAKVAEAPRAEPLVPRETSGQRGGAAPWAEPNERVGARASAPVMEGAARGSGVASGSNESQAAAMGTVPQGRPLAASGAGVIARPAATRPAGLVTEVAAAPGSARPALTSSGGAGGAVMLDRPQAMRGLLQRTGATLMPRAEEPPLRQLASALAAAMRKGDGTVTINLRPEHLGPMRVDLRVEGRHASALFHPTTESARQLLVASEGLLRSALEARGLQVDRIEVAALPEGAIGGTRTTPTTHDGVGVAEQERPSGEDPQSQDERAGAGGRGGSDEPHGFDESRGSRGSRDSSGSRDSDPNRDLDRGAGGSALAEGADRDAAIGADLMRRIEGLLPALGPTVGLADVGLGRGFGGIEAMA